MLEQEIRDKIAAEIREKLGTLIEVDKYDGGYDCCGCSTYWYLMEDAARIAEGRPVLTKAER